MFEDSTFESMGRIRTRSRGWMIAVFALNSSILMAMILVPLIYPQALSDQHMLSPMRLPPPPVSPPPAPPHPQARTLSGPSRAFDEQPAVQQQIQNLISNPSGSEPGPIADVAVLDSSPGIPNGNPFGAGPARRVIQAVVAGPVRISSGVAASIAIEKVLPLYPAIAKAAGIQGTVVLAATISRSGTVENLHVISGPAMLQQAALDAVKTWRYHPYQLNGDPVEVETTVNVVFKLGPVNATGAGGAGKALPMDLGPPRSPFPTQSQPHPNRLQAITPSWRRVAAVRETAEAR